MTVALSNVRTLRASFKFGLLVLFGTALASTAKSFDTAPYFPLGAGSTWRYVVTKKNGAATSIQFDRFAIGTTVVTGAPPTVVNGTTVNIVRDTRENHLFYYTNDSNGVRQHGAFDPTFNVGSGPTLPATFTFSPPQISLLQSATLGASVTSSGIANLELQGLATFPLRYTMTSTPEAFETLTSQVSGFMYHSALRVRTITTLSGTITVNQRSVSVNTMEEAIDWLVPTLGIVKHSATRVANDAPKDEEIELLTSNLVDDAPDPLVLIPSILGVAPNSTVTSNPFTVSGINVKAPIWVRNGKYSIDGGPYTDLPGAVGNGQVVTVQVTAPPGLGQGLDSFISIGNAPTGVTQSFTVTTQLPSTGPYSGLYFYIAQPGNSGPGRYLFQLPIETNNGFPAVLAVTDVAFSTGDGVKVNKTTGDNCCNAGFYTPSGKRLTVGPVENSVFIADPFVAQVAPNGGMTISYRHDYVCQKFSGRFVTLELARENLNVTSFAANFQQRCDDTGEIIVGQVRYNSMIPFDLGWSSFTPTPFTFDPPTGVTFNGPVRSNPITVSGIVNPATISVTNGAYSINGGAYSSTTGTVQTGDVVILQVTTAGSAATQSCASLDIGGVTRQFCATTPTVSTGNAKKIIQELIDD